MMLTRGQHPKVGLRDPLIEENPLIEECCGVRRGQAFAGDLWISDQTQENACIN
jgi:hypothetical protein